MPCDEEETEDVGRCDIDAVEARVLLICASDSDLLPALVLLVDEGEEFPSSRAVIWSGPMSTSVGPEACLRATEVVDRGAAYVCESFNECMRLPPLLLLLLLLLLRGLETDELGSDSELVYEGGGSPFEDDKAVDATSL